MIVKIKKLHKDAVIPKYAKPGDAALDLTAVSYEIDQGLAIYKTGIALEIPEGHVGLIFPRSSICNKNISLSNSVGVIDSGFRGEIIFKFRIPHDKFSPPRAYAVGDRIGQIIIMPYPQVQFEEVIELNSSERGTGGFGSSGK